MHRGTAILAVAAVGLTPVAALASPSAQLTVIHTFSGGILGDGPTLPGGGLVQGADGNFYGTTLSGGSASAGAVYKLTPQGSFSVLHSFGSDSTDGSLGYGELVQASDGNFYGTTYGGGDAGNGTVYRVSSAGTYSKIYSFGAAANDGLRPKWGLVQGSDGALYGTTAEGGSSGGGTAFRITTNGTYTVLHSFGTHPFEADGAFPSGPLTLASDGYLYGLTTRGGVNGLGTLYRLTLDGQVSIAHAFGGCFTGSDLPFGKLVEGPDHALYGVSESGGGSVPATAGTAFAVTPHGPATALHIFPALNNGFSMDPQGGLALGADGNYYGLTARGGANDVENDGAGTAFMLTPDGSYVELYSFGSTTADGFHPIGPLIRGMDGKYYGNNQDVIFALDVSGTAPASYPARRGETCAVGTQSSSGSMRRGDIALFLSMILLAGVNRRQRRSI